jgi:FemAB-related protein (PEP-CTERM system-associated)
MNAMSVTSILNQSIDAPVTRSSSYVIRTLEQVGASAWNDFINQTEGSLPTQTAEWQNILRNAYGISCHFLVAEQDGVIRGVLPLYRVKSILMGDSLQSMSGAVCAASPCAAQALFYAADELALKLNVDYLLLRDSRQTWDDCGMEVIDAHRGVRLHLPADRETAWNNLNKRLRKDFRYGNNKGIVTSVVCCDLVEDFYEFILRFNHQMGTPSFSKNFMHDVAGAFPARFNTALGYNNDRPVAGVFCLIHRNKAYGIWGGALREHISMMPTHHVYWAIIEAGIEQGLEQFDIGRSPYPSTQFDFKMRWCDESYPIYQLYRIYRGKLPPNLNLNQAIQGKGGVSFVSRAWPKLPLPVARYLGPMVRRHLPFG